MKLTVVKVSQSKNGNWWISAKEVDTCPVTGIESRDGKFGIGMSKVKPSVSEGDDIGDYVYVSDEIAEEDERGIVYYLFKK